MEPDLATTWPLLEEARRALAQGTGRGVKVAVIDSGVDTGHPALKGLKLADEVTVSCDGVNLRIEDGPAGDAYGHGTAVASLLRETAPDAVLGSFRALDSTNQSRSFVIAECVNQAISRGYRIINCSFGCRGLPRFVMDYKEWVDRAYLEGVLIVAACSNVDVGVREWPAFFPSVIGVRGIDCEPEELFHCRGRMVSFLARGERVEVPWLKGGTKIETGSSFAAPLVTGKIARLLSVFPTLNPAAVKPLLAELATPWTKES